MSLDADLIVDRRRMRRKLTFWRVLAIAVVIVAIGGVAAAWSHRANFGGASSYIARVNIKGLIRDDEERVKQLEKLAQSSAARAVIVHIDSPGGTTAGSEQLYDALTRLKAKKPLVIVVDGLAASGGYITAIAGDHIIAKQTSIVGSIGVLFQFPNVSDLLNKIGVKVETIKSSPLKASPNGFEPTSPEARAAIDSLIQDTVRLVQEFGAEPASPQRRGIAEGRRRPRLYRPPGHRPEARRRARRRTDGRRLARQGKGSTPSCRCMISNCTTAFATCRSCTPPLSARFGRGRDGRAGPPLRGL